MSGITRHLRTIWGRNIEPVEHRDDSNYGVFAFARIFRQRSLTNFSMGNKEPDVARLPSELL
jgi:hypothetical protein